MPPRRGLVLAAVVLALGGCEKEPHPCFVTGVSVGEGLGSRRLDGLGLDRDDLRRSALAAFGRTRGFRVGPDEPGTRDRRCRGTVALLDARVRTSIGGGNPQIEVLVALTAAPADSTDGVREVVRHAESVGPVEDPRAALRRAVDAAAVRAASGLALALAVAEKPDAELVRDLDAAEGKLRDLAVQALADRRSPAALPALVARLKDPDPEVADRAVGALAQIRDPRAVGPLIDLTRRREGPFVSQIVRIIGDIGGDEARAYLETVRTGHPDPEVRDAAGKALSDLRRRPRAGDVPATGR
jgi:HEAT repeat protein